MKILYFLLLTSICFGQILTQIDNQVLHLKGGVGITVTGAGVSEWADQSGGTTHNFVQATDADRPGDGGTYVDFDDANTEFLERADHTDFEFGDGSNDSPFSVYARVYIEDATNFYIMSKTNLGTTYEWHISSIDDILYVTLYSNNNAANRIVRKVTGFNTYENQIMTLGFTYDATEASSGIIIYKDGVVLSSVADDNGIYVALIGTSSQVYLGTLDDGTVTADGRIYDVILTSDVLTPAEISNLDIYFTTGVYPSDQNGFPGYSIYTGNGGYK